jgi:hypothetical protein
MRKITLVILVSLASIACKKNEGFAPSTPTIDLSDGFELAYGASSSDRTQLANRIAGNDPPRLSDVITNWKRFSGTVNYLNSSSIVANPAHCQTTMDGNGSWANSISPAVNPNTHASCNTESMNSLSWVYLSGPDRLFNIQNTTNYTGFFSNIKIDTYTTETNVSSTDVDDDTIGVTVAIFVDPITSEINTLSALRTQGGNSPVLGWALVHKRNNNIIRVIGEKSVGGTNKNNGVGGGDSQGWNGRYSKIRIERTGNIVKAYCSPWSTNENSLAIDNASLIEIDLSNPAESLNEFSGPQSYGYESLSEARATFSKLSFLTPLIDTDPEYLYDLKDKLVYKKKAVGIGYELLSGLNALAFLGSPRTIYNNETQREFRIESETAFTEK